MGSIYNPPPQLEQLSPLQLDSFGDFLRNCDLELGPDQSMLLKLIPKEYHSRLRYHPGRQIWTLNVKNIVAMNVPLHIAGAPVLPVDWKTPGYKGLADQVDPLAQCNSVRDETIEELKSRYPEAQAFLFLIDSSVLVLGAKGGEEEEKGLVEIGGFRVVTKPDMSIAPASTTPSPTAKSQANELEPGAVIHVRGWKYHGKNGTEPLAGVERGNIGLRIKDHVTGDEYYTGTTHHRYISVASFIEVARNLEAVEKEERRSREGLWDKMKRRFSLSDEATGDEFGLEAFNPENIKNIWLGNGNDSAESMKLGWYSESYDPTASVHTPDYPRNYQHDLSLIPCHTDSPNVVFPARLHWAPFVASSNEKTPLQVLGVRQTWRIPIGEAYIRMAHPELNGGQFARASIWRGINDCRDMVVSGAPIGTPNLPGDSFGVMGFQNFSVRKGDALAHAEKGYGDFGDRPFNLEFWGGYRFPKGFVDKFDIVQKVRPGQHSIPQSVLRGQHHPPKLVDVVDRVLDRCSMEFDKLAAKREEQKKEEEDKKKDKGKGREKFEEKIDARKHHEINKEMDKGMDMEQDKGKGRGKLESFDAAKHHEINKEMDRGMDMGPDKVDSTTFPPGEPTNAQVRAQARYANEHRHSPSVPESPIPDTETSTLFRTKPETAKSSPSIRDDEGADPSPPPSPASVQDASAKHHMLDETFEEAISKPIPTDEMKRTHIHITDYDKSQNADKLRDFDSSPPKKKPHLTSYADALEEGNPADPSIKFEQRPHEPTEDDEIVLTPGGGMSQEERFFDKKDKKNAKKKYTKEELARMEAEAERRADAFQWALEHATEKLPKNLDPHEASVMAQIIEAESKELALEDAEFNRKRAGGKKFSKEQIAEMEAAAERRADAFQWALEHADDDIERENLSKAAGKELPVDRDVHKAEVMAAIIAAASRESETSDAEYSGTSTNVRKLDKGKGKAVEKDDHSGPTERHEFKVPVGKTHPQGRTRGGIFVEHLENPLTEKDKSNTVDMREELDLSPKDGNFAKLSGQALIEDAYAAAPETTERGRLPFSEKESKIVNSKLDFKKDLGVTPKDGNFGKISGQRTLEENIYAAPEATEKGRLPFAKEEGNITDSTLNFNKDLDLSPKDGNFGDLVGQRMLGEPTGPVAPETTERGRRPFRETKDEITDRTLDFDADLDATPKDGNFAKLKGQGLLEENIASAPETTEKGRLPFDRKEDKIVDHTLNFRKDLDVSPKDGNFGNISGQRTIDSAVASAPEATERGRLPFDKTEDKILDPVDNLYNRETPNETAEWSRNPFDMTEDKISNPKEGMFSNYAAPETAEWGRKSYEKTEEHLSKPVVDLLKDTTIKAAPETSEWEAKPWHKTGKQMVDTTDNLYNKDTPPGGIHDGIESYSNPFEDSGKQVSVRSGDNQVSVPTDKNIFQALADKIQEDSKQSTESRHELFGSKIEERTGSADMDIGASSGRSQKEEKGKDIIGEKLKETSNAAGDRFSNIELGHGHTGTEAEGRTFLDNVGSTASNLASKASDLASSAVGTAQSAASTASEITSKATEAAGAAATKASGLASGVVDTAGSTAHGVAHMIGTVEGHRQNASVRASGLLRSTSEIVQSSAQEATDIGGKFVGDARELGGASVHSGTETVKEAAHLGSELTGDAASKVSGLARSVSESAQDIAGRTKENVLTVGRMGSQMTGSVYHSGTETAKSGIHKGSDLVETAAETTSNLAGTVSESVQSAVSGAASVAGGAIGSALNAGSEAAHVGSEIAGSVAQTGAKTLKSAGNMASGLAGSIAETGSKTAHSASHVGSEAARSASNIGSKAAQSGSHAESESAHMGSGIAGSATGATKKTGDHISKLPVRTSVELHQEPVVSEAPGFVSKIPVKTAEEHHREPMMHGSKGPSHAPVGSERHLPAKEVSRHSFATAFRTEEPTSTGDLPKEISGRAFAPYKPAKPSKLAQSTDFFAGATGAPSIEGHTEPTDMFGEPPKVGARTPLHPSVPGFQPSGGLGTPVAVPEPAAWISAAFEDTPVNSTETTTTTSHVLNAGDGAALFQDHEVSTPVHEVHNKHLHGLSTLEETHSHDEDLLMQGSARIVGERLGGDAELPDLNAPGTKIEKDV